MTTITTVFADLDGSGVRAMFARADVKDVVAGLSSGQLVRCDSDLGEVWVGSSAVRFVQAGRRSLPVSSGPAADAVAQHQRHVTPAIG